MAQLGGPREAQPPRHPAARTSTAGLSPGQITSIKQAGQDGLNLSPSASSGTAALCFGDGFQGKRTRASQMSKNIHPHFGIKHKPLPSDGSKRKWDPVPHPCCCHRSPWLGTGCQLAFGLLRLSCCILVCGLSPRVPLRTWPCPGAPPASARVPAACGLTPSAGSEISLHQVNCQTAQSLKLNIKDVARRRRVIPPPPPQQKAILAVQAERRWIPGLGQHRDGAAGDGPHGRYGTSPQHSPGPRCCRSWANPELQTDPFPEVSLLWYGKG